jgi:hypothetical protein
MEIGEFHNRDGWYFTRLTDGAVRIRKTVAARADSPVEHEHVIPANEWASIVAHVSARGEAGDTYTEASDFHAGRSLLTDVREFAQIAAAVHPDGSMSVRFAAGRIPAQSFAALYRFATRVTSPNSAFDVEG